MLRKRRCIATDAPVHNICKKCKTFLTQPASSVMIGVRFGSILLRQGHTRRADQLTKEKELRTWLIA